ncbi:MAG: cupin domain-containing protein [Phycisphaerae bacterium]|jgi:mannose-6-phosphate isomerase-like protein (cupin superfamily)
MSTPDYRINLDVRFGSLELIDVARLRDEVTEQWFNQTLCTVNDCAVRLGVVQGEFHWHHHDAEDEFFYVVSGRLLIDLDDRTVELHPNQGFTVPRGVRHRTRAPDRTAILMIEGRNVQPTGD